MRDVRNKYPDRALERTAGMEADHPRASNNLPQIYASSGDLQTRYLRRRFGLSSHRAGLIAGLFFGEDT